MSIYRWMGKEYGIYIPHLLHSMKHYSAIKKNGSNNMNGPRDNQTKWSKSERERQIPYDITYMWTLNYKTNEHIYETETDSQESRLVVSKDRSGKVWSLGLADANYYIQQQSCSTSFPGAQTASLSTLNSPQWLKVSSCSSHRTKSLRRQMANVLVIVV